MKLFKFTGGGGEYTIEIRNKKIFNLALRFIDELDLSIKKWREMEKFLKGERPHANVFNHGDTCALCINRISQDGKDTLCHLQCPVYIKTGIAHCTNTPWTGYALLKDATAEREFLEGLRDNKKEFIDRSWRSK